MKSKRPILYGLVAIGVVLIAAVFLHQRRSNVVARVLEVEWIDNTFPEKVDDELILPFGYTLGLWPAQFLGEPIVMKMAYQKGPPQKFIPSMTQLWKPVEVELKMDGPRTIEKDMKVSEWKKCFTSVFGCGSEKEKLLQYALSGSKPSNMTAHWFDSQDPLGPRGLHLVIDSGTHFTEHYTIITANGVAQNFILKYVKTPVGMDAKDLFRKTLSGLKVKDDLSSSRAWIQSRIQSVKLDDVRSIPNFKVRLNRMIQVQNWIFSLLSVDPTQIAPFFHLAGVTHMLTIELLKSKEQVYESQESWILNSRPLMEVLIRYAKDFEEAPDTSATAKIEVKGAVKNMETLLQDILLLQDKISRGQK